MCIHAEPACIEQVLGLRVPAHPVVGGAPHRLTLVRFAFFARGTTPGRGTTGRIRLHRLERWILLVHAASTWALAGLIWVVQIAHYPSFALVGAERFRAFHASYTTRIGRVVGPLMLVELACALWIVAAPPYAAEGWPRWIGLALVIVAWASTAFVQVPAHRVLARGFDANVHQRLVASNWIRTIAWSARAVLVLVLLR